MPSLQNVGVFDAKIIHDAPGEMKVVFSGHRAKELFAPEAGGHRWQRIPPTERGGRKHSSTITVAVLDETTVVVEELCDGDLVINRYRASGPGGQKRNKVETAIRIRHKPSGIVVCSASEASQKQNLINARRELQCRVTSVAKQRLHQAINGSRKSQIGKGERSDKIRTVQMQNGKVINHVTGKSVSVKDYLKGKIERVQ